MNESNQNFDELKRLLKLKRHEVPPPGYFHNFSGEVLSRLRAGEADGAESLAARLHDQVPWLSDLLRIFEIKPGVIGGLAVGLCLVLLLGVVLADRSDSVATDPAALASSQAAPEAAPALASVVPAADNNGIAVSTNPVISLQPVATLFGGQQNPLFQPASFMPSGQ